MKRITFKHACAATLLGLTISAHAATVSQTSYTYDAAGNLVTQTDGNNNATQYSYDAAGHLKTVTDPLGHALTQSYDPYGRLTTVQAPDGGTAQLSYDGRNNIASITDPRRLVTQYRYNVLDQTTQTVTPDAGTLSSTYDAAGKLATQTDGKGQLATYTRDNKGRIITLAYANGPTFTYGYGTDGRLATVSEGATKRSYVYDAAGRITSETRTLFSRDYVTRYLYDAQGRLATLTYPSGLTLGYGYTGSGKLNSITRTDGTAPQVLVDQITWRPFGPISGWHYGNDFRQSYATDAAGHVTAYQLGDSSVALAYDAAGRLTSQQITGGWWQALLQRLGIAAGQQDNYAYDANNRLTSWQNGTQTVGYAYDLNGNRSSITSGGQTQALTISTISNRTLQVNASRAIQYDANGNTLGDGPNSLNYDAAGNLKSANGVPYTVNALGQRVGKIYQGRTTLYHYDQWDHLIAETDETGIPKREYVYLGDRPVAVIDFGAEVRYVHTDPLGTPRLLTDRNKNPIWSWQGEPFGNTAPNEDPEATGAPYSFSLRFPGQYADAETGLFYNHFRYYDPTTGRYVQYDPLGLGAGQFSTYAYTNGNPLSGVDPMGMATIVMAGGPVGSNPAGHIAIAFTGQGTYSYGTSQPFGSSTTAYLANQASYRDTTIYLLPTTPGQEQTMIDTIKQNYTQKGQYSIVKHDCATMVADALSAAGIGNDYVNQVASQGGVPFAQIPYTPAFMAASFPGTQTYQIPRGSTIPAYYQGFNQ